MNILGRTRLKGTIPKLNYQLKMLENKEDIEKYSLIVWNLLVKSYENLGGLKTYRDYKDFVKKKHLIMIAVEF